MLRAFVFTYIRTAGSVNSKNFFKTVVRIAAVVNAASTTPW